MNEKICNRCKPRSFVWQLGNGETEGLFLKDVGEDNRQSIILRRSLLYGDSLMVFTLVHPGFE